MQTPEFPDGSNEAVKRDEQAHTEAECEADEERALWGRVDAAESRVEDLERCIKAMVAVPGTMLACASKVGEIVPGESEVEKLRREARDYRGACVYTKARLKEWCKLYGVSV